MRCFGSMVDEERDKSGTSMACGIMSLNGKVSIG